MSPVVKAAICLVLGVADLVALNAVLIPEAALELGFGGGADADPRSTGDDQPADSPEAAKPREAETPSASAKEPATDDQPAGSGTKVAAAPPPASDSASAAEPATEEAASETAPSEAEPAEPEPAEPEAQAEPEPEPEPEEVAAPEPKPNRAAPPPDDVRVYFKTGSSRLKRRFKRRIRKLARSDRDELRFRVVGRTDYRGSSRYNEKLGFRRARSVARALKKLGIEEDRIEIESLGEEKAQRKRIWRDRRVEVLIEGAP